MLEQNQLANPKLRAQFEAKLRSSAEALLSKSTLNEKITVLLNLLSVCSNQPSFTAYYNAELSLRPLYLDLPILSITILQEEDSELKNVPHPNIYGTERNIDLLVRKGMYVPSYLGQAQLIQFATTVFSSTNSIYWLALQRLKTENPSTFKDVNDCIKKIIKVEGVATQIKHVTDLIDAVTTFESVLSVCHVLQVVDRNLMMRDMNKHSLCKEVVLEGKL